MSQVLETAKRFVMELELEKRNLERDHQSKQREIAAAGQGVTGLVMVKLIQDLSNANANYERALQSVNSRIMTAKSNVEMLEKMMER